jgi:hypothetical protein
VLGTGKEILAIKPATYKAKYVRRVRSQHDCSVDIQNKKGEYTVRPFSMFVWFVSVVVLG